MELFEKKVMITGGTRGLGRAMAEQALSQGADVWVIGRKQSGLSEVAAMSDRVHPVRLDVSEAGAAATAFDQVVPDVLILNAGATPKMAPVQNQGWEEFSVNWATDVRSSLEFGAAALKRPMARGSAIVTISSGAAIGGSFASGGYAGAKRMQWFLSDYFQREADDQGLGLRFLSILPKQQFAETELGQTASNGYAKRLGISHEEFLARFKDPLTPSGFASLAMEVLTGTSYEQHSAFGISGAGIERIG